MKNKSMILPTDIITNSPEDTESVGKKLASFLCEDDSMPKFVAMYGDLGVGKTAFVRGFCSEICRGSTVKSPTFALVNEYRCSGKSNIKKVCHFDMYRIVDEDDLYSIGFYDYLNDEVLCIAEWCELIPFALPEKYVKVEINKEDLENKRKITISLIE